MGKESNTPFTYLVTFKEEYSLDQKRSCSSWKIRIEKCCLFFEFVWFSECHFTYSLNLQTRTLEIFFKILNFYLTFVHPISKVWRLIKFPIMISWPNIMQIVKIYSKFQFAQLRIVSMCEICWRIQSQIFLKSKSFKVCVILSKWLYFLYFKKCQRHCFERTHL